MGTITDYRAAQNAIFDANSVDQTFGLRRRIGARAYVDGGVTLSRSLAQDARFSYRGARLSLGTGYNWANGWQVGLSGTYEKRPYDQLFSPLIPTKREDRIYGLNISLLNSTITFRGATPRLSCGATWTSSNIVFYDSRDVVECSFALTSQF
ncbi:MAG: surface lipoprotein assembly modifier [Pseudomonadota bacterium]